jgi:hypothetical protein
MACAIHNKLRHAGSVWQSVNNKSLGCMEIAVANSNWHLQRVGCQNCLTSDSAKSYAHVAVLRHTSISSLLSWFARDAEGGMTYSLENSHNPFAFNGRVAAIFMVRLWFAEP